MQDDQLEMERFLVDLGSTLLRSTNKQQKCTIFAGIYKTINFDFNVTPVVMYTQNTQSETRGVHSQSKYRNNLSRTTTEEAILSKRRWSDKCEFRFTIIMRMVKFGLKTMQATLLS